MKFVFTLVALLLLPIGVHAQTQKPYGIEDFIKKDRFQEVKISPKGTYAAATVPLGDKTVLFQLCKDAGNLAHRPLHRVFSFRQVLAVAGEDRHATFDEQQDAEFLHHEVTGKPGNIFNIQVRSVCQNCNSGWMNRAEGAVRPFLDKMIAGHM